MSPEWRQHLDMAERSIEAARELLDAGHSDFALSRAYYATDWNPRPSKISSRRF